MSCRKPVSTSLWASSELESPTIQPAMPASNAAVMTIVRMLSGCCHQGNTITSSSRSTGSVSTRPASTVSASRDAMGDSSVTRQVCQRLPRAALRDRLLDLGRHRATRDDLVEVGVLEPVAHAVAVDAFGQAFDDRVEQVLARRAAGGRLGDDRHRFRAEVWGFVALGVDDPLSIVIAHVGERGVDALLVGVDVLVAHLVDELVRGFGLDAAGVV